MLHKAAFLDGFSGGKSSAVGDNHYGAVGLIERDDSYGVPVAASWVV